MKRSASTGSFVVPLFFLALVLLASLAALPSPEDGTAFTAVQEQGEGAAGEPTFHAPVPPPTSPSGSTFCAECHSLPPHEGEGVAPAFNNDHTSFVDCLVCHWPRRAGEQPDPDWSKRDDGFMLLGYASLGEDKIDRKALREGLVAKQLCFDKGLSCSRCHSRGAMEPYIRPGLSPQGQAALENLPDFFTITKGTKWYFPQRQ